MKRVWFLWLLAGALGALLATTQLTGQSSVVVAGGDDDGDSQVAEVTGDGGGQSDDAPQAVSQGAATLEEVIEANRKLLERQQRIIERLEVLEQDARQTKIFSKRS